MTVVDPSRRITADRLRLRGLTVCTTLGVPVVDDIDLQLVPGEILGLVGESGSGKTTTALSLLGYSTDGVVIRAGELEIAGTSMHMDESMRPARGAVISYVPQDPSRALNPSMRIRAAIEDVLKAHHKPLSGGATVGRLLEAVGLPSSHEFASRFPHQLSGGQQQRVAIAMALACDPVVIVLDEPTTGLDVVTQERILRELLRLRDEREISMVYVTHDLAVVAQIADRIAVMYSGRIVEQGVAESVLMRPRHPYTRGLLASIPDHVRPRALDPMPGIAVSIDERPSGCTFAPRCSHSRDRCRAEMPPLSSPADQHKVRCFYWKEVAGATATPLRVFDWQNRAEEQPLLRVNEIRVEYRSRHEVVVAADGVSFGVARGSCVALVGESGSGKTSIARAIAGLHPIAGGQVTLDGIELPSFVRRRSIEQRRRVQLVNQNPSDALNPKHTVADTIGRPARLLRGLSKDAVSREIARLLECVRLPARIGTRFPSELSGGERQRVAIARALAANPELILCDEITSALDVSVQAAILDLLTDLRKDLGVSVLFITHDLGVVATVADELLVLETGTLCEIGPVAEVLRKPQHPYTQHLLGAAPSISGALDDAISGTV